MLLSWLFIHIFKELLLPPSEIMHLQLGLEIIKQDAFAQQFSFSLENIF